MASGDVDPTVSQLPSLAGTTATTPTTSMTTSPSTPKAENKGKIDVAQIAQELEAEAPNDPEVGPLVPKLARVVIYSMDDEMLLCSP